MALIEGVGDEVTALFALLAALLVLALAWLSTRTAERAHAHAGLAAPPHEHEHGPGAQVPAAPPRPQAGPPAPDPPGSPAGALRRRTSLAPAPPQGQGGAGNLPPGDAITLRLKFLNDTERLARAHPEDTVGGLKRAQFPGQEQLVRLIYRGQWLRDDSLRLGAVPLGDQSVLHCHLPPPPPRAPPAAPSGPSAAAASSSPSAALNVGGLLVPLLALLLGALWYLQLQHRHVFTATATACLAGLTLLASLVAFAAYRR